MADKDRFLKASVEGVTDPAQIREIMLELVEPLERKKLQDQGKSASSVEKSAWNILKFNDSLDDWCRDCVSGNLPEIGQSALCVDLDDGLVFRDYEPSGKVTPQDENTVIVSVYDDSFPKPADAKEKRQMMKSIEKETLASLSRALIELEEKIREQKMEQKTEQTEEHTQMKGRGR